MKKAVGYIRVSTADQANEGVSMDAQKAKIEAWCIANDFELINCYEDAGISGTKDNRKGLEETMKSVGKNMALVVYSMSRISRSTKHMLAIAEVLDKRGADLVSLSESIDTTTPAGKMVFRMMAVLNEFEIDQVRARTKFALQHLKDKGEVYGVIPFGFKEVSGRLVEIKTEMDIVSKILFMREEGAPYHKIADYLNNKGIKGKKGGCWHASTVRYLIKRQEAA